MAKAFRKWNIRLLLLALIPVLLALGVWLSALAFVPVPWPDDSAFYFVAKELFRWPPRWVMLPQAPFEPTYQIFNFNTMPLYPPLIGLGRLVGIDGSFLIKIWPLSAWALSGSLLVTVLYRKGLPFLISALIALAFALDPELRWASVLIRPESLIGLFGMTLILGLTFGFPDRFRPRKLWDPVAALLALGAYCHFNAIHLLPAVLLVFIGKPQRLWAIGAKTILYLSPWIFTVLFHWKLFRKQMETQWSRLAVSNDWLSTPTRAMESLFQSMGSPEPWHPILQWASAGIWLILILIFVFGGITPLILKGIRARRQGSVSIDISPSPVHLLPALGWVGGALWLFHSKPEVWFVYYIHAATWCLVGLTALKLWQSQMIDRRSVLIALCSLVFLITASFTYVDVKQAVDMGAQKSWNWETYTDFVSCVDNRLTQLEKNLGGPGKPFHVWCPTFPDITIELSRRHPDWQLTRTNDFGSRNDLAIQHGWSVEAVVVTETLGFQERTVSQNADQVPGILSTWMLWKDYYLNRLWTAPHWKPNRYICQRGKWQAFLFMTKEP